MAMTGTQACSSAHCSVHPKPVPISGPRLTDGALAMLAAVGLDEAQWARVNYMRNGIWCGDRCGCMDDRCIGHHHYREDNCGCLPAMLEDWLRGDPYQSFAVKPPGPLCRERRMRGYMRQRGYAPWTQPSDAKLTPRQRRRASRKFARTWF